MSYFIKQSTSTRPLLFLMVLTSDHISPATGLSPTVTLSKLGGSFASPAGTVTEIANGWYQVAGNATDSGTLGPLILHATASGADPTDVVYRVVAFDPDSATNLGLSNIDAAVSSRSTLAAGAQMDIVNAPNSTAVTAIQNGLATAAIQTNIKTKTDLIATNSADSPNTVTAHGTISTNINATISSRSTYAGGAVASVSAPVSLDLTQSVPTSNTAHTVGDALNAARAQGFGKWVLSGTTLTLYASNGTTVVRTFTLDDATTPTTRS